jgi:DnaJ domain/Domain of unknown function (DUF4388)
MNLPGRLAKTTLGDLCGILYRDRASGTVELTEDTGPVAGRSHRLRFDAGLLEHVDSTLGAPRLGEWLLDKRLLTRRQHTELLLNLHGNSGQSCGAWLLARHWISPDELCREVRAQSLTRLGALFDLRDARVTYRVARSLPPGMLAVPPLTPEEFLCGRPRSRDRAQASQMTRPSAGWSRQPLTSIDPVRRRALLFLGLAPHSSQSDVRRAFRRIAARLHPDRHLLAPQSQQEAARERFVQVANAYNTLMQLEEPGYRECGAA